MSQFFQKPIEEVIKSRFSCRNYREETLPDHLKREITQYLSTVEGPYNEKVRFALIDGSFTETNSGKIGTYGVIRGANTYIAAVMEGGEHSLEDLGYRLEKIILYLTSLGLGTCWLGGTFKRSQFASLINLKDYETLPIVTPVGYIRDKKSIMDSFIRYVAGSKNRKEAREIFFNKNLQTPLAVEGESDQYIRALEMVRIGPSASNKQPWRIIKNENRWDFHLHKTKGYSKSLGFDIQRVDMGIAMCHFEMTLKEAGIKGHWSILQEVSSPQTEDIDYIISWIED